MSGEDEIRIGDRVVWVGPGDLPSDHPKGTGVGTVKATGGAGDGRVCRVLLDNDPDDIMIYASELRKLGHDDSEKRLIDAAKELRDAAAAMMRILFSAQLTDELLDEFNAWGIEKGFGPRFDEAIKDYEERHPQ